MDYQSLENKSFRFAVLCDSYILQHWQVKVIQALLNEGHQLVLLIRHDEPLDKLSFIPKIATYPYRHFLYRIVQRFLSNPKSKKLMDMSEEWAGIPRIDCKTLRKGYGRYFFEEDLDTIRSYHLDFALRFGFSIIRGEILEIPRFGIWSYHHEDHEKYRGVPTGFWEIFYDDPVNGAVLQRLTDKIDAGIILKRGWFKTQLHSWSGNIDNLYYGTVEWPLQVARELARGNMEITLPAKNGEKGKLYKLPGNRLMLKFLVRLAFQKTAFHFREMLRSEKWKVGIIRRSAGELMNDPPRADEIYWLPDPGEARYLADPFVYREGENLYIACERYDYRYGKGNIELLEWDLKDEEVKNQWPMVRRKTHMAYPYLFSTGNKAYCLPENADSGDLELYSLDRERRELRHETDLINDIDAVDATLFTYEQRWWLLFTRKEYSGTKLYAWYANDLKGPYSPHYNNPVKTDIRSSRPAGNLFYKDGILIRPAQDGSRTYGGRIALNKLIELSPYTFKEETISHLEPDFDKVFNKGTHTISTFEHITVIDCKKHVFIAYAFIGQLKRKVKRILGIS